jgi:hypothetical protein
MGTGLKIARIYTGRGRLGKVLFPYKYGQFLSLSPFTLHHLLKMELTQCSETSAFNTQTPGKYPEDFLSIAQLFHKLSHWYMFRHYRFILRQPVINTLPSYTSISNAAVGNTIYK